MIDAMPAVVEAHPSALYIVAGQTHPDLLRSRGEAYRKSLVAQTHALGIEEHVAFIDEYMSQRDIIDLLLTTDVYVTPYLEPNQITSGTLAYALGAGKAIVSTRYLHAVEALADGRGVLVGFRAPDQLAHAVIGILDDPAAKDALEQAAYAYAREATWPRSGQAFLDVAAEAAARAPAATAARPQERASIPDLAHRLAENPILTAADVPSSLPGLEVVSVFNAAAAQVDGEVVLLLRVGERPRTDVEPGADALTLDISGPEPQSLEDVLSRQKDIQFASRDDSHIARQQALHRFRHIARELVKLVPEEQRNRPEIKEFAAWGCGTFMHIVRLNAPYIEGEGNSRDIDFTTAGIRARWKAGHDDTARALEKRPWENAIDPMAGVAVHDCEPTILGRV